MNHFIVDGRLGKDPEMRYLPTGTPVCNFSLANKVKYQSGGEKKEETTWFDVVFFGKIAETISKYFSKGDYILVVGRVSIKELEYQVTKKQKVQIIGKEFQFGQGGAKKGGSKGAGVEESGGAPAEDVTEMEAF